MSSTDQTPLIGSLGDLIEDLVIDMAEAKREATDTEVTVSRRRGGSAANVAAACVVGGARGRFLGCVGDDAVGDRLLDQLTGVAVESRMTRSGLSGTVVALIDVNGERSLLTDRGSSADLANVPSAWLDGLDVLHVPAYAFTTPPLATAAVAALAEANKLGMVTSIDASAVPVIEDIGVGAMRELLLRVNPTVLFCNSDEAAALNVDARVDGTDVTVVKRGPGAVTLFYDDESEHVPAIAVRDLVDTTGAGDAFAAGFLIGLARGLAATECASMGHRLAAHSLLGAGSLQGDEEFEMET